MRGPNLFLEYLNRPGRDRRRRCGTAGSRRATWRRARRTATSGSSGRRATDLIKSGGYKIGAGEIENALLEHPAVAEAAVTGEPDDDLGERIVAWVVVEERRSTPGRARAGRPRRAPAHAPQAPARGPLPGRAAAQRDGEGHEGDARRLKRSSGASRADHPGEMQGRRTILIAAVVALVAARGERSASLRCIGAPTSAAAATRS